MAEETEQEMEKVAKAAEEVVEATTPSVTPPATSRTQNLDFILDVSLDVTVEVGRCRMTIQDLLQLGQGSVIELSKLAGEPLDVYINDRHVARGEAVIVNEKFGVRVTDIISQEERVTGLG